ncbi:MAG: tRNA pseudouridine(38-40) synthase TruA [Campylobacterota bacterium]|nr:tRNA pseudouridine(38-40) synthase TruA [Campylobacterota bacterium]
MRVALTIAYNGTYYFGSQTQTETPHTILGELQKALKQLGIKEKVIASGRTDKGVHASGQVCHIDLPPFWDEPAKLKRVLNEMLPSSILIKSVKKVSSEFHARYSAKKRMYRYIIKEGESNPFEADYITFLKSVDFETIQKNIQQFIGEHDFVNFMKTGSDTGSSVREVYKAFAYRYKGYIILNFQANGFLRSQIRLMVGSLLYLNDTQIQEMLNATQVHKRKPAPPNGLYLAKINY